MSVQIVEYKKNDRIMVSIPEYGENGEDGLYFMSKFSSFFDKDEGSQLLICDPDIEITIFRKV